MGIGYKMDLVTPVTLVVRGFSLFRDTERCTMEMEIFQRVMRRRRKKPHVVQGLVQYVNRFADFLTEDGRLLTQATINDIDAFFEMLEADQKGLARKVIRGIALYYEVVERPDIAKHARSIRNNAISKTRRIFPLKEFWGVNGGYVQILAEQGIVNVNHLINAGKTPANRAKLARLTGIPLEIILEYVKLSDLTRIGGLRKVRARLYYDTGFDTIDKIAASDPEEMRETFIIYINETGFAGIAPLPKELRNAVGTAIQIERLVEY